MYPQTQHITPILGIQKDQKSKYTCRKMAKTNVLSEYVAGQKNQNQFQRQLQLPKIVEFVNPKTSLFRGKGQQRF